MTDAALHFLLTVAAFPRAAREDAILAARDLWVAWPMVEIAPGVSVTSDVFALGTIDEPIRVPLSGPGAQRVADVLGLSLITHGLSDAVWRAAEVKLEPDPWGPPYDATMLTVARFVAHNGRIEERRAGRSGLIAGHKKDVIQASPANPGRVVIYGWHRADGHPIQPVYPSMGDAPFVGHELSYADYSHGIRLRTLDPAAARYPT